MNIKEETKSILALRHRLQLSSL